MSFNESGDLQTAARTTTENGMAAILNGFWPTGTIYRNRKNHQCCAGLGIRMNGRNLGRPRKDNKKLYD
jgi:hypothetical protein